LTAITWSGLQQTLQAIIARTPYPYAVTDGAFSVLFPQSISYAENRIYNDIPFLAQRGQDTSLLTTPGLRSIDLSGTFLPVTVAQRLALVTPAGATLQTGTQVPFMPASVDLIDMYWPKQSQVWAPNVASACYWSLLGGNDPTDFTSPTVLIAPTPDAAYQVVLTGLFTQPPISETNQQTYLSTNYPEVMIAACMVFLSGALLRNYSSAGAVNQPDEAGMPVHWEGQYGRLKDLATAEELRRHQQGTDWLNRPPAPAGAPPGPGGPR
jgi:hypothetical protein